MRSIQEFEPEQAFKSSKEFQKAGDNSSKEFEKSMQAAAKFKDQRLLHDSPIYFFPLQKTFFLNNNLKSSNNETLKVHIALLKPHN